VSDTTELDKTRRYLRPVRATCISDDPSGVHLAVYSWLEMFDAWATGPGLCGESMMQGPLPEGTEVTCPSCLAYQPKYETALDLQAGMSRQPADDGPDALRAKLERIRAEVAMLCDCCGNNRQRMGRIRAELGLDTDGYFREDGEDG
jgi:hypothetical protein